MSDVKGKVLIIDDDDDIAESMQLTLEAHGYEVARAADSKEGFVKLDGEDPDLVILDMMMEGKGAGFLFSRKMRKEAKYARVPILMITGMREQTGFFFPGKTKDPVFLPVDEFMEKPVESKALVKKVAELLGRR
ncbi:MAG: response regulator [Elusimicrobia bacterium]|nr:response regulator [Elusimicrobiota bacterium]